MTNELRETILNYLEITAKAAGFGEPQDLTELIGALIGAFLSLLGIIFLILILYGGFVWMTSGGSEARVYKAKKILERSIIGIIIILSAYAITAFVFSALTTGLS